MLTLLILSRVAADGGFFSRSAAVSADQRAIIIKNGNEISMTFSTAYSGEGEEFGWIIPTPVPPAIDDVNEAGENGETAFRILDGYSAPVFFIPQRKSGEVLERSVVTVYGRATLEHYEVSVLGAAGSPALLTWFRNNGYKVDATSQKLLDSYIEENWAFVAVKLRPAEERHYENEFLPPLTIRYHHDRLIFPVRISAASTARSAKITLYVIAESTIRASNYTTTKFNYVNYFNELIAPEIYVEHCIQKTIEGQGGGLVVTRAGRFGANPYQQQIYHELARLLNTPLPDKQACCLTRLEARMDPAATNEDIRLVLDESPDEFRVSIELSYEYEPGLIADTCGVSELMYAAATDRDADMVSGLLEAGAEVNAQDALGVTALMYASHFNRNAEVLAMLLEAGAEVNARDMHDGTALMRAAAFNQNAEMAAMLLEAGAEVNARDEAGRTALMYAAMHNQNSEVIATLLEAGAEVNARDEAGRTALIRAAESYSNPTKVISVLLAAGAEVNARDTHDETALMKAAAYNRNSEVTAVLLEGGAEVNVHDEDGRTALIRAAENNSNPKVFSMLLKADADVNACGAYGTALMQAVKNNANPEVISMLLEAGAEVNAHDEDGWTALMEAAWYKRGAELIAMLLEAGADVNACDTSGRTALIMATHGPSSHNVGPDVISVLLDAGADVNAQDNDGNTPLLNAVGFNRNPDVVSELLEAGADVNAQNNDGQTALIISTGGFWYNAWFEPDLVLLLLDAGADAKRKDRWGRTALDNARSHLGEDFTDTEAYRKLREAQNRQN
jgi:ankyrin repeat protein